MNFPSPYLKEDCSEPHFCNSAMNAGVYMIYSNFVQKTGISVED